MEKPYSDEEQAEWDASFDCEEAYEEYYNDEMDGDHQSALSSAGMGTDEDYGHYADEMPDDDYFGYGSGDY